MARERERYGPEREAGYEGQGRHGHDGERGGGPPGGYGPRGGSREPGWREGGSEPYGGWGRRPDYGRSGAGQGGYYDREQGGGPGRGGDAGRGPYGRELTGRGGFERPAPGPPGAREWRGGGFGRPEAFGGYRRETIRGPYSGRGPKGYQRSDERIREDVNERLWEDGEIDASEIEVHVQGGEVTLTGTVESRQMKRLAEDLIESVPGVKEIHNQLRASGGQRAPGAGQTGAFSGEGTATSQPPGSRSTPRPGAGFGPAGPGGGQPGAGAPPADPAQPGRGERWSA